MISFNKFRTKEDQLRFSEEQSHVWIDHSPVCTKIVDLDFNLQFMSSAGVQALGIDDIAEYYGKPYPFDFYPPSFCDKMTKNLSKARDTGDVIEQEAAVVDLDGNEVWFHSTISPVSEGSNQIDYFMIVSIDTTAQNVARKKLEQLNDELEAKVHKRTASLQQVNDDLFDLQARYRELFANMNSGCAVYTRNVAGQFIFSDFNQAAEHIEKISKEEVLGRNVEEVFPQVEEFGLLDVFKKVWATGTPANLPLTKYEDQRLVGWRENYVYKLPSGEIVAVYDDVTERKQAEIALKESEEYLYNLLQKIKVGVVVHGSDTKIMRCNKASQKLLGLTEKQMLGKEVIDPVWKFCDEDGNEMPLSEYPSIRF